MKETDQFSAPRLSAKGTLKTLAMGGLVGGVTQSAMEALKVIDGDRIKFPDGWNDYSLFEEFSEGAMSAMLGMLAGKLMYKSLCKIGVFEYNPVGEVGMMTVGGVIGYFSMVVVGGYIHQKFGVPDVKWGPFK